MSQQPVSETKIKTSRKRYSEEFKINAIKLLDEGNRTQQVLATELGISVVTLGQWKRRYGTAVVGMNRQHRLHLIPSF